MMEKYYVTDVESHEPFCQIVTLKNRQGQTETVTLNHSIPKIPIGTKFKVYQTANKEPFPLSLAHSYKIKGRRFVNIAHQPITKYGIKHNFWNRLTYLDCVQLNYDIKQALHGQGIKSALNKTTNLILLLNLRTHI